MDDGGKLCGSTHSRSGKAKQTVGYLLDDMAKGITV